MAGRVAEVVAVLVLATVVTVILAAPVLRAPSERVFGMAVAGRHHDPFTTMRQFERPVSIGVYSQPITDISGALLARITGGVAAYNWLVLLSFPLSAVCAYLLARHLALSPVAATFAAMAYAFSPFHLAHAAYHLHIAQTHWVPLYLLALWRCLNNPSATAVGLLVASALTVTLSNFYGGLIAIAITPVAVAVYWFATGRGRSGSVRRLGITFAGLAVVAVAALGYASYAAAGLVADHTAFVFPRSDLFLYSAKWWSYAVPAVAHPLLGASAQQIWAAAGVREGLVEQQVSLGWGLLALGLVAMVRWSAFAKSPASFIDVRQTALLTRVPVLAIVGLAAFVCSLTPERAVGQLTIAGPSAVLYSFLPMFRAYARFGVVVQLMVALLAGIGIDCLRRASTRTARIMCLGFVGLAVGEYAVAPAALWRDVLPTAAHRWIARQSSSVRVLDCMPLNQETESVQWLTAQRVTLGTASDDCTEPNLSWKLAATGYTHLLVRRDSADGQWFARHRPPDGLSLVADFDDGQVFAVTAPAPRIYTATMDGFFAREHDADWTWRWMGTGGSWAVVNTGTGPSVITLGIELSALFRARHIEVWLDGRRVQTFLVDPSRHIYQVGPLEMNPGSHDVSFRPSEAPTVAHDVINNGDPRALSVAVGAWSWRVREERP